MSGTQKTENSNAEQDDTVCNKGGQIVFEYITDNYLPIIKDDAERLESSQFSRLLQAIRSVLSPGDILKTRIVITADFEKSVTSRQADGSRPYTIERGSGVVAGKTMQMSKGGVVDIIFPFYLLVSEEDSATEASADAHVDHVGKHEAVHAHLRHLDTTPFEVNRREEFSNGKQAGDYSEESNRYIYISMHRRGDRDVYNTESLLKQEDAYQLGSFGYRSRNCASMHRSIIWYD